MFSFKIRGQPGSDVTGLIKFNSIPRNLNNNINSSRVDLGILSPTQEGCERCPDFLFR